jgi:hypothetical protein
MKSSRGTLFRKHLKAQREITSSDKTVTAATIMSARENVGSGVWQGECVFHSGRKEQSVLGRCLASLPSK